MDEADRLCDRLAIIDHGKIAALGTPRELKGSVPGQDVLTLQFLEEVTEEIVAELRRLPQVREAAREGAHAARRIVAGEVVPVEAVTGGARRLGVKVKSMSLPEPTLDDVFLHYTGRAMRDAAAGEYQYQVPNMMR